MDVNSSDCSKNKRRKMSTTNDKSETRNENSKKVEESFADSGFHSGFQDSCEISSSGAVVADNKTGMEGNSHSIDKENLVDSGMISSGYVSETKPQPTVTTTLYVPDFYLRASVAKPHHAIIDKYFEQDDKGYTKLHIAILHNFERAINALVSLAHDSSYLDIKNFSGQTALHLAVLLGQVETVKKLINAGADINVRDNRCNTALHLACLNDDLRCVLTIISAVQKDRSLLANLEHWNYDGETCFYIASKANNVAIMKALVASGSNVNAREGRSGYTALHTAVETRADDVIRFLCEECNTMCIDTENYGGLTAFQLSLLTNQEPIANYLMSKGATPYFTAEDSEDDEDDASDYSGDELEQNQIISKIAEIVVI